MSIETLKQYIDSMDISQSKVAALIGVSPAVVSQYLKGEYKGDVAGIDKKVAEMLERQNDKARDVKTDFVETPTAKDIFDVCSMAHVMADINLIIGEAGLGKTVTLKQYAKKKVTWLNNPLASNHRPQADGLGHAVDLVPSPIDWNDPKKFDAIAHAMFTAEQQLKAEGAISADTHLRWGADWDSDGHPRERGETDSPHFEI